MAKIVTDEYFIKNYTVQSCGSIFSKYTKKLLRPSLKKTGYLEVTLSFNGKTKCFLVHRLVATKFLENDKNLGCVNHKDGNRSNNDISNLEWCNHVYNNRERLNKKITQKDVENIKTLYGKYNQYELAKMYSLDQGYISQIINGKRREGVALNE